MFGADVRGRRLVPWVEKYRPRNVDDIASQEDIIKSLKNATTSGNVPHMLFYGPAGTGKTSTILAMCRDMYGPELMKTRVMELNASEERGIAVVRDKVKVFAQVRWWGSSQAEVDPHVGSVGGGGGPPFKMIILDEADSLTADAQAALRRTMETYSRVTRFCIICNYVSRIIDPVASRCSKYRFKPLGADAMKARLLQVAAAEGMVGLSDSALDAVLAHAGGDMRKAITTLQSTAQLHGPGAIVTPEAIAEGSGAVPAKALAPLLALSFGGEGAGFDAVRKAAQGVLVQGYPILAVLEKLADAVIAHGGLSGGAKAAVLERISLADKCLADGADEELQLVDVAATLLRVSKGFGVPADKERSYL